MLVLLPPSEGKTVPGRGHPVALDRLSFPELNPSRAMVLDALERLCATDPDRARQSLGLSAGQLGEVTRNAVLLSAPTAPAGRVYSGVLYAALDLAGLDASARRRASRWLAIGSAAFGLLRPGDRIPAYRLSAGTTLPGPGSLSGVWRGPVAAAIRQGAGRGVVLDLRSGAYASLAPVPADLAPRTVTARVLTERHGRRSVVSHANKATKGLLVRALLRCGESPADPQDLAGICGAAGFHVEVSPPARDGRPWTMDVVVADQ